MNLKTSNDCISVSNENVSPPRKLTGYIEYRLQLFTGRSYRKDNDNIHDDLSWQKSRKRKINQYESLENGGEHDTVGFFFTAENDGGLLLCETSIRIFSSESMMRMICHAARSREKVIMHKYSWGHYSLNDNESK